MISSRDPHASPWLLALDDAELGRVAEELAFGTSVDDLLAGLEASEAAGIVLGPLRSGAYAAVRGIDRPEDPSRSWSTKRGPRVTEPEARPAQHGVQTTEPGPRRSEPGTTEPEARPARLGAHAKDTAPGAALPSRQPTMSALAVAEAILGRTRRTRLLVVPDPDLHPLNLARAVATLAALHPGRIGVIADDPAALPVLSAVSALWDTWPLDAMIGDTEGGRYVDDTRIARVSASGTPHIGGPLTLPVDIADKPVLVWAGEPAAAGDETVDLVLRGSGVRLLSLEDARETGSGTDSRASLPGSAGAPGARASSDVRGPAGEGSGTPYAVHDPTVHEAVGTSHGHLRGRSLRDALDLPPGRFSGLPRIPAFPVDGTGDGTSLDARR